MKRREMMTRAAAACAAVTLHPWQSAFAQQSWPQKPIKFVNMAPPGTAPDTYCRIYAERLSKSLGVGVIVDNRPGVAGNLASEFVAKAPADGYTFLYTVSSSFTVNPSLYKKLPFNPESDFKPVAPIISQATFIVANNDLPFKTVKELVAYAKQNPGKLAYGSNGIGGFLHLIMEVFNQSANVQMLHVPYKGTALLDIVSGQVQLGAEPTASAIPMIKSGKVRAIAYSGTKRHPQFPDVPTIAETYPGLAVAGWHGIWAPAGVPGEIIQRLNAEVTRITQTPEVQKLVAEMGSDPLIATVDSMAATVRAESKVWGELVRAKNITIE